MGNLFDPPKSFLQTNAWQNQNLNALRYNTSQAGSVVPIIYGQARCPTNLLDLGNYQGPQGKKGKVGPLPITGTSNSAGKGGGKNGGGKKGGKKSGDFSVDVSFGLCQGPIFDINQVYANAAVALFHGSLGLNLYKGDDGQAPDPTFQGLGHNIGYSGTCYVTGTPMDLGQSPVLPNISFEIQGFLLNTSPIVGGDANPAQIVQDFLTNIRYGAGFPAALLDPDIVTTYGEYCDAASLGVSLVIDGQQTAAEWISGLAQLTNTEIVWSGKLLKFISRGDLPITGNGVSWDPHLVAQYSLTDDDFIPFGTKELGGDPAVGEDDPIQVTRTNPADATNWVSIEYTDRGNFYNSTILAVFDQGMIDAFGLRTGNNLNGKAFCNKVAAQSSAQLFLQKLLYVRNTYKFQLGWKYALLEPMDAVLLTGKAGDSYLNQQPVRITSIEENENGDLTVEAYEVNVGQRATYVPPAPTFLPGGGGVWDCETIAHKFDVPPQTLGVLENDDKNAVLLSQGLFNQCSFSSARSNDHGKFYFEMARYDHQVPDLTNYMRFVIDLDNFLLWMRLGVPNVPGMTTVLIGIGNGTFTAGQATTWPGQVGFDDNGMSWGCVIGAFSSSFYFRGSALSTPWPNPNGLTWNSDPTADPVTGVGGIDITGGRSGPAPGPWFIIGQSWSIGLFSPTVLQIFTSSTGFQNTIPAGIRGW